MLNAQSRILLEELRYRDRDILVLGAGGFTLSHNEPSNRYTYVDIDPAIREIAECLEKCIEARREAIEIMYEITGISDIMRGSTDAGETAAATDMRALLEDLKTDAERHGHATELRFTGDTIVTVRPDAFKRCVANLVGNAQRHGQKISIEAVRDQRFLTIHVDDDGPGIPPENREDVFRPFFRLDEARNQDEGGTGLGLTISLARSGSSNTSMRDERPWSVRMMTGVL